MQRSETNCRLWWLITLLLGFALPVMAQRANTGKWQTAKFLIPDAGFGGFQANDADFRFHSDGDELLIRAVSIHRVNP